MGLFEKRVKVFEVKGNKKQYKEVKAALKAEKVGGIRTTIWTDEVQNCGCGAKLDNRDFGPNGKIDRDIYSIRVAETEQQRADEIVRKIVPGYVPYEPKPDRFKLT